MKKRQIKIICIFISVALLLLFSFVTFASNETTEGNKEQDALDEAVKKIANNVKIIGFDKQLSEDDAEKDVYMDPLYYFSYSNDTEWENGKVKVGDNTYDVVAAVKENGELRVITSASKYDEYIKNNGEGGNVSQINFGVGDSVDAYNKQFENGNLVFCLRDSEGNIVAECAGRTDMIIDPKKNEHIKDYEGTNLWQAGLDILFQGDFSGLGKILTESIVAILLPCGDGFLHMMSQAMGEVVTIDKIVFGEVEKISIDFFSSGDNALTKVKPLKNELSKVINEWYTSFLKVAILFYAVLLVYMGIRIILASTGNKKAEYKTRLVAWTMGVVMLMFFPYVMKYTILANQGLCRWIGEIVSNSPNSNTSVKEDVNIGEISVEVLRPDYGTNDFVAKAMGYKDIESFASASRQGSDVFGNNVMLKIRLNAKTSCSIPLAVVYLVLLGETMALIILYYKRVFMLAFLITIFPLAAMFYTLNKTGDMKLNSFGTWFKEFVVNVFVQTFHAATYVTVVTIGLTAYKENGDWLFFLVCVLFLFQGEKIIRAIFNAQSSAGTIGDMAAAGALAFGMLKNASKLLGGKGKSKGGDDGDDSGDEDAINDKAKANQAKANQALNSNTSTQGAEKNKAAAAAADAGNGAGGATAGVPGASSGNSPGGGAPEEDVDVKLGREPTTSHQEVYKSVNSRVDKATSTSKHKVLKLGADMTKDLAGFVVRNATGAASAAVAGTFALAQHTDAKSTGEAFATAVTAYGAGKKFGQSVVDSAAGGLGNIKEHVYANKIAEEYENGEHDDDFVINEADEELRKKKLEAYRKVAAKVARDRSKYGKDVGEKLFIREELDTK